MEWGTTQERDREEIGPWIKDYVMHQQQPLKLTRLMTTFKTPGATKCFMMLPCIQSTTTELHSISENTAHIEICNNTAAINFNETGCYDHLNLHFYDRKDRHN